MSIDQIDVFWKTVPTPEYYLWKILRTHPGSKWCPENKIFKTSASLTMLLANFTGVCNGATLYHDNRKRHEEGM